MSQVEQMVTVKLRLDDARALSYFARMGLVWVLRNRRVGAETHHRLGRGLYGLKGAIDDAAARDSRMAA